MLQTTQDEPLGVEVRRAFPDALVVIAGEIDAANVGELYELFAELAREGFQRISLNLAELTFMDSTGLSLLVAVHKRTHSSGGELVIFSPTRPVQRLFAIAGLDAVFTIRPMVSPMHSDAIADAAATARHDHQVRHAG